MHKSLVIWNIDKVLVAHLDGEPFLVPPAEMDETVVHVGRWKLDLAARLFSGRTLDGYCKKHGFAAPSSAFLASRQLAELVLQEVAEPLGIVPLGLRTTRHLLQPRYPRLSVLKRWVNDQVKLSDGRSAAMRNDNEGDRLLYGVPHNCSEFPLSHRSAKEKGEGFDAVNVFKYLKNARHLKDVSHAPIALTEAIELACTSESLVDSINDNMPDLPLRTALYESKLKLDAVAMAVERRWLNNLLADKKASSNQCILCSWFCAGGLMNSVQVVP